MKKSEFLIAISLVIVLFAVTLAGCAPSTAANNGEQQIEEVTGTVKFIELEGGFYGILGDDGERYDPMNLSPDFQKDGLRVKVQARLRKDVATTHMWGTPVELTSIERLD